MSIFYDPQKKAVKPWVYIVFIAIPILLFLGLIFGSKPAVEKYQQEKEQKKQQDIFEKL